MDKNIKASVLNKIDNEYRQYREDMLKKPKEEIFDFGERNGFYNIRKYFFDNWPELVEDADYELLNMKEKPLDDLWEDFIITEECSLQTNNGILEYLDLFFDGCRKEANTAKRDGESEM